VSDASNTPFDIDTIHTGPAPAFLNAWSVPGSIRTRNAPRPSARPPSPAEMEALLFAWTVVGRARSNAIVLARADRTLGIGAGQTSRVDAVDVALMKARRAGHELGGAVLASDGFFPFADNVEHSARAGITAIVQPGGSVRDAEVIAACDLHRVAMMFTDRRTFRH